MAEEIGVKINVNAEESGLTSGVGTKGSVNPEDTVRRSNFYLSEINRFLETKVGPNMSPGGSGGGLLGSGGMLAGLTSAVSKGISAAAPVVGVAVGSAVAAKMIGGGLANQFTEDEGAPDASSIAVGDNITNLTDIQDGVEETTQEFSNLRAGMDSTIEIQNDFDASTGEVTSRIVTQDDKIQNLIDSGTEWMHNTMDNDAIAKSIADSLKAESDAMDNLGNSAESSSKKVKKLYDAQKDLNRVLSRSGAKIEDRGSTGALTNNINGVQTETDFSEGFTRKMRDLGLM